MTPQEASWPGAKDLGPLRHRVVRFPTVVNRIAYLADFGFGSCARTVAKNRRFGCCRTCLIDSQHGYFSRTRCTSVIPPRGTVTWRGVLSWTAYFRGTVSR